VFLACLFLLISFGFKDGEFTWTNVFTPLGIFIAVVAAIGLPFMVAVTFFLDNTIVYIIQLKRDGAWTNAWASLDPAAARDVAATITSAIGGVPVSLNTPPGYGHEGDLLLFGELSFPVHWVSSAVRRLRPADRASELGGSYLGAGLLILASTRLLEAVAGPDFPYHWLLVVPIVAAFLFFLSSLASSQTRSSDRSTRYVHLIQLRGEFGRRNVYATIDESDADAIVSSINNAVAANAQN
jgi:hypothetical protein